MSELRLPQRNLIVWFEIPVHDLDAATEFYARVLGLTFRRERRVETTRAVIEDARFANSGALVEDPARAGADGSRIYLHAGRDLAATLQRTLDAGGHIDQPARDLGAGLGRFAVIRDPSGNRIGLHSPAA